MYQVVFKANSMKYLFILVFVTFLNSFYCSAQIKKMYLYLETDWNTVMSQDGMRKWRPEVPYKQFVRLATEIFEVPANEPNIYYRYQFYEHVMKYYYNDFKKLKLHNGFMLLGIGEYDPGNPNKVSNYELMFKPDSKIKEPSWQHETILIKGFKYDPNFQKPGPNWQKAERLMIKGIE